MKSPLADADGDFFYAIQHKYPLFFILENPGLLSGKISIFIKIYFVDL